MSLLNALKTKEEPFEFILPRKGSVDASPQRMEGCIEEPFAPSLGAFAVAGILFDVRDHSSIENALAIVRGIKASVEIQIGSSKSIVNLTAPLCTAPAWHGILVPGTLLLG
jgi:hypothetical protein